MVKEYNLKKKIPLSLNNKKLNVLIIAILFVFQVSLFSSEPALELNLTNIKSLAVKHNRMLKNARLDIKIAKNKVWETTSSGLPQIDGILSYQDMTQIPTTLIPAQFIDPDAEDGTYFPLKFGTQHNVSFEIVASQLIFNGTYIVALQSTKIYMRLSKENLIKTEIEIKSLVTRTYYLILISEQLRDILEKNLKNLNKLHYEISELYKAGFLEETDVDQMEFFIVGIKYRLNAIKRQIELNYNLLKHQIGFDLGKKIKINNNINSILKNIDYKSLLIKEFDIEGHIDLKMANTQLKSASLLLKKEKSLFLPTISAFISHKESAMRNEFNFFNKNEEPWFPSTIIGLNLNIPIFSSGMRISRVRQYKYDLDKAFNLKQNVKDGLSLNYMKIKSEYLTAFGGKESSNKSVQIAEKIYNRAKEKFKKGVVSSVDLIQIYNQYLESQYKYISALIEFFNKFIELQKFLNII